MDYKNYLNTSAYFMKPSGIRKFFDLAAKMEGVISLGVGEPDFKTDWSIRNAAIHSVQKGITQYTANAGLLSLRREISDYLNSRYNVSYLPEKEILVTVGASEGIDLSLRALINPGDEILIPEPSYVSYAPCVVLSGGVPVSVDCKFEEEFKLNPKVLESKITDKTKALILPYPNNPTGSIMTKSELEAVAKVVIKHDLIVVSDEIYSELTYGEERHVSIASLEGMWERTILLNGFSKSFAMTGWRVGYVCAPTEILKTILKIHQYCIMCAPTMSQYAALEALKAGKEDDYSVVSSMLNEYDMRRKYLYTFFNEIGMDVFEPKGAFYIFPSTKSLGLTGEQFAEKLLEKQKVAVVPGSAFGKSGEYNVRISYAYSMQSLIVACEKIREFIIKEQWKE